MNNYLDAYVKAMTITDQSEADDWFEFLVAESEHAGQPREEAKRTVRSNLGYYAGYYDAETRERVERLFKCEHPYFGKISEKGQPTPEQAYAVGLEAGRKAKEKGNKRSAEANTKRKLRN